MQTIDALKKYSWLLLLITITSQLYSCKEKIYTPKPRSFPKISFPTHEYQSFEKDFCNLSFEYPKYATITKQDNYFDGKPTHPCWFDINLTPFNGSIHCTYSPVENNEKLYELINDSYELKDKHIVKANFIDEPMIDNGFVQGTKFEIHGPTATSIQFFLTDSTANYFQASLYFNTPPNPDSLLPIIDFVKKDINHMIKTFKFK